MLMHARSRCSGPPLRCAPTLSCLTADPQACAAVTAATAAAAVPNRALMSRACQIHPQALSDFELDLCISLNWDITKLLRAHDLLQ